MKVANELNIPIADLLSWKYDFAANKHQSIEEATEAYGDFYFQGSFQLRIRS